MHHTGNALTTNHRCCGREVHACAQWRTSPSSNKYTAFISALRYSVDLHAAPMMCTLSSLPCRGAARSCNCNVQPELKEAVTEAVAQSTRDVKQVSMFRRCRYRCKAHMHPLHCYSETPTITDIGVCFHHVHRTSMPHTRKEKRRTACSAATISWHTVLHRL